MGIVALLWLLILTIVFFRYLSSTPAVNGLVLGLTPSPPLGYSYGGTVNQPKVNWGNFLNLPFTYHDGSSFEYREKIYLVGGKVNNTPSKNIYVLSMASQAIEKVIPVPFVHFRGGIALAGDMLFVIGGFISVADEIALKPSASVIQYSLVSKTPYYITPLPQPRYDFACVYDDSYIYVIGGRSSNGEMIRTGDRVDIYDWGTQHWVTQLVMFPLLTEHAAVVHGKYIYASGGWHFGLQALYYWLDRFDPKLNEWESIATMPVPLSGHQMFSSGDSLILVGGRTSEGHTCPTSPTEECYDQQSFSRSVYIYNVKYDKWFTGAPMSSSRGRFSGTMYRGVFYVIGGLSHDTNALSSAESFTFEDDRLLFYYV